ncbi:unnamed protein product [Boreogadus saida]
MEEIDSATTSTEPAPSDEADSTHDSVSANGKTYRFNPQWLKTFNWLVYDQSKKSMFCSQGEICAARRSDAGGHIERTRAITEMQSTRRSKTAEGT